MYWMLTNLREFNKKRSISCWYVDVMLTCVGDSWEELLDLPEDEGDTYSCEDLHDGCKLIKRILTSRLSQA